MNAGPEDTDGDLELPEDAASAVTGGAHIVMAGDDEDEVQT